MTAPEIETLMKLEAEVGNRLIHGDDDVPQICRDIGASTTFAYACKQLPAPKD